MLITEPTIVLSRCEPGLSDAVLMFVRHLMTSAILSPSCGLKPPGRLKVHPVKIPIFFKASHGCAFTMRHLRAVDAGFVTK